MIQYVIFNVKEEADAFGKLVDNSMGYPKKVLSAPTTNPGGDQSGNAGTTYSTFATPIKKYNAEKYAYPVTEAIQHLVPDQKELKYDLENWYPDGII